MNNNIPYGNYQGHIIPLTEHYKQMVERTLMFVEEKLCNPKLILKLEQETKEYAKKYYQANKKQINSSNNIRSRERVKCECGVEISYGAYYGNHKRTNKHRQWEEEQQKQTSLK
jgi:hypothetical protein